MHLIDGIHNVSLANGLVRVQTIETGPDGQQRAGETLAIPANRYAAIVQLLHDAGQRLQQQGRQASDADSGGAAAAADGAADADPTEKVDFSKL